MNFIRFFVIWLSKTPTGGGRDNFLYKIFSIFRRNGILMSITWWKKKFFIKFSRFLPKLHSRVQWCIEETRKFYIFCIFGVDKHHFRDLPVRAMNFFSISRQNAILFLGGILRSRFVNKLWILSERGQLLPFPVACLWRNFWKWWKIDSELSNQGVRSIS